MKQLKQLVANFDLGRYCNATSFQHQVIKWILSLEFFNWNLGSFASSITRGKTRNQPSKDGSKSASYNRKGGQRLVKSSERRATTGFRVSRDEQTRCTCTYSPSKSSQREQPEAAVPVLPCFRATGPSFLKIHLIICIDSSEKCSDH